MNIVTIQDYPVEDDLYYIVLFKNILKAKLAPYHFTTIRSAERGIEGKFTINKRKYCRVLSGKEVKAFFLDYKLGVGIYNYKYDYDDSIKYDARERRNRRIIERRRLRRMGLYTSVRPSKHIKKGLPYAEPIDNYQKMVVNRKNPQAKAISIEDKPGVFYLVLERQIYKNYQDPKYLYKLKAVKYEVKNSRLTEVTIKIRRNAILRAFLLEELNQIVHETCEKKGRKVPKKWRKYYWYSYFIPIKGR